MQGINFRDDGVFSWFLSHRERLQLRITKWGIICLFDPKLHFSALLSFDFRLVIAWISTHLLQGLNLLNCVHSFIKGLCPRLLGSKQLLGQFRRILYNVFAQFLAQPFSIQITLAFEFLDISHDVTASQLVLEISEAGPASWNLLIESSRCSLGLRCLHLDGWKYWLPTINFENWVVERLPFLNGIILRIIDYFNAFVSFHSLFRKWNLAESQCSKRIRHVNGAWLVSRWEMAARLFVGGLLWRVAEVWSQSAHFVFESNGPPVW